MMRAESLQLQLSTAMQRLSSLRRRAEHLSSDSPRALEQTLSELEFAIEQLRAAQEELAAQREEVISARQQLEAERKKYWEFFDHAPDAYLVTRDDGTIVEANRAAADLLNISQRFLVGKNFAVFVGNDRNRVLAQAQHLAEYGGSADWVFAVRPRERAPFEVACRIHASDFGERSLRWLIRRISRSGAGVEETTR